MSGHNVYEDDLTRTLFAGDDIGEEAGPTNNPTNNPINPPTYVSLETELRGLLNIKKHSNEFNRIASGLMGRGGNLDILMSVDPSVIDRLIAVGLCVHHYSAPAVFFRRVWSKP